MRISSLHIHPVKAMRAVDVTSATVNPRGFQGDRRWLVVDSNGLFVTQRTHPLMATIAVQLTSDGLKFVADGHGEAKVSQPDGNVRRKIAIWDTEVDAAAADAAAGAFISRVIGDKVHLVFMDKQARRLKTSEWTPTPVPVSFADAFPILVTTTGSLQVLNQDIEQHGGAPVPMARFRPNLVIDCDEAWDEDHWPQINIGNVEIDLVKLSDRCIVTTTDQMSGQRSNKEPLASLARIHRSTDPRIKGVLFGVNAVPRKLGQIRVGDAVEVVG